MDESIKDQLYREIQSFFSNNTVLVVGSGLSCAEGLAGMWLLAVELVKKVPELVVGENLREWERIKKELVNEEGIVKDNANLEAALLKYPPNEELETVIRRITTNLIISQEKEVIHKVVAGEKQLRFSNFIKRFRLSETGLVVVCTNYDRLVEIACEIEGIPVDNLFYGKNISHLNEKKSRMSFCEKVEIKGKVVRKVFSKKILIFKPHGCLNWYWSNGRPINSPFELNLDRLIITPGANKFRNGYDSPFDIHREKANNAIDQATRFIVIGYGFNDEHLETHLKQRISSGVPALLITRSLSENTRNLIKGKKNVITLSYFENDDSKGTEILFQNKTYYMEDTYLWDINDLVKVVF